MYLKNHSVVKELTIDGLKLLLIDPSGRYKGRYGIDKLLKVRTIGGKRKFLVKWLDCDESDNTWEPEKSVQHAAGKIDEFNQRQEEQDDEATHIDGRPKWMPSSVYDSLTRSPDNSANAPCPGCREEFLVYLKSGNREFPSFEYYHHMVEECPGYKQLNILRKCDECPLVSLTQKALSGHKNVHK